MRFGRRNDKPSIQFNLIEDADGHVESSLIDASTYGTTNDGKSTKKKMLWSRDSSNTSSRRVATAEESRNVVEDESKDNTTGESPSSIQSPITIREGWEDATFLETFICF